MLVQSQSLPQTQTQTPSPSDTDNPPQTQADVLQENTPENRPVMTKRHTVSEREMETEIERAITCVQNAFFHRLRQRHPPRSFCKFAHTLTLTLTHSLTHSLTHTRTHSLTHTRTHTQMMRLTPTPAEPELAPTRTPSPGKWWCDICEKELSLRSSRSRHFASVTHRALAATDEQVSFLSCLFFV